jgi:hypothetical protein
VVGGLGLHVGLENPQRLHVPLIFSDVALGDLERRDSFLVGAPDDLVIDVREVLDESNSISCEGQIPTDDVEGDGAPRVADV